MTNGRRPNPKYVRPVPWCQKYLVPANRGDLSYASTRECLLIDVYTEASTAQRRPVGLPSLMHSPSIILIGLPAYPGTCNGNTVQFQGQAHPYRRARPVLLPMYRRPLHIGNIAQLGQPHPRRRTRPVLLSTYRRPPRIGNIDRFQGQTLPHKRAQLVRHPTCHPLQGLERSDTAASWIIYTSILIRPRYIRRLSALGP